MKTVTQMALFNSDQWQCPHCGHLTTYSEQVMREIARGSGQCGTRILEPQVIPKYFVEVYDQRDELVCTSVAWQSADDAAILASHFVPLTPVAYRDRDHQWHTNLIDGATYK